MILLCFDGSDASRRVLAVAHEILGNVPATVLHLWDRPATFLLGETLTYTGMPPLEPQQVNQLDELARERAERLLAEGVTIARDAGFEAGGRLEPSHGSPWRTILEVADAIDAALIVVGDHGLGAFESALLGTTSSAIVHHTHRPVLVVPAVSEP